MISLSVKYRPKDFSECLSQKSVIKILENQITNKSFSNVMLFSGASGCGKTTIARIVANKINNNCGQPIEIDGASNNSVDDVRQISDDAQERSLDSEYKVYIIDECHSLSNQAWQAFLKTIEEPPKYTIFMFCTTDPQKLPETIKNRCQIFKISKVSDTDIKTRLEFICKCEGFTYDREGLDYIVKLSEGSVRQSISYLDKCKDYSTSITYQNVISCLGDYSYDIYFNLTNCLVDNNKVGVIDLIDYVYNSGTDLKTFINNYLNFILQVNKYCILKDMSVCKLPQQFEEKMKYTTGIENNVSYFESLLDKVLKVKVAIKNDTDIRTTIQSMFITN